MFRPAGTPAARTRGLAQLRSATRLSGLARRVEPITLKTTALVLIVMLQACTLQRLAAVPEDSTEAATVPGIPDSRLWLDRDLTPFIGDVVHSSERERNALLREGLPVDPMPPLEFLAISGGGDSGAFAAGVLCGWTASGTRPTFKVVTGISAGALIAPFAFLGSAYDDLLREVVTSLRSGEVFRESTSNAAIMEKVSSEAREVLNAVASK